MNDGETRVHHLDAEAWAQLPPGSDPADVIAPAPRSSNLRSTLLGVALVLVGAVMGTLAVTALEHPAAPTTAAGTVDAPAGAAPGVAVPQGVVPDGGLRGGGGLAGEQRVIGTVAQVGSGSVTIRTGRGSATYVIDGATDIRRNGQRIAVTGLAVGEPVLVHVIPTGTTQYAERILAGGGPVGAGTDDGTSAGRTA